MPNWRRQRETVYYTEVSWQLDLFVSPLLLSSSPSQSLPPHGRLPWLTLVSVSTWILYRWSWSKHFLWRGLTLNTSHHTTASNTNIVTTDRNYNNTDTVRSPGSPGLSCPHQTVHLEIFRNLEMEQIYFFLHPEQSRVRLWTITRLWWRTGGHGAPTGNVGDDSAIFHWGDQRRGERTANKELIQRHKSYFR